LINLDFLFSSEEELRPKSDKTMVAQSVGRGIANFCMHGLRQKGSSGKKIAARGFVRFAGQRPVRQRSLSAESVFGYFCRDKSNQAPAAMSGTIIVCPRIYFKNEKATQQTSSGFSNIFF